MKINASSILAVTLFALLALPAHAKNVDFSSFAASCSQMSAALSSVETQLNKMRPSNKNFLRIQLQNFQKLSRIKTSGSNCTKINKFFQQQANKTRTALRNRAATSNARAVQMTAQLNQFTADMQTLQVVLGAAADLAGSEQRKNASKPTNSSGEMPDASNKITLQNAPKLLLRCLEITKSTIGYGKYRVANICEEDLKCDTNRAGSHWVHWLAGDKYYGDTLLNGSKFFNCCLERDSRAPNRPTHSQRCPG